MAFYFSCVSIVSRLNIPRKYVKLVEGNISLSAKNKLNNSLIMSKKNNKQAQVL